MNEELMKKLVEALKSRGLSDEDIESVKLELTEKTEDKKTPEEPKGDDVPTPPAEEPKEPEEEAKVEEKEEQKAETNDGGEKVEEEKKEEVSAEKKVEETPAPAPEEVEKPAEEGNGLPKGVDEIDPENPVVEEQPSPEAPASPDYEAMYNELKSQLEEERNARAGLEARLESALSALEESGVISPVKPSASPVGVDDPTRVGDLHEQETTMDAVLKDINLR